MKSLSPIIDFERTNPEHPFYRIYASGFYLSPDVIASSPKKPHYRAAAAQDLFALSRVFTLLYSLLMSRNPDVDYIGLTDEVKIVEMLADVVASLEKAASEVSFVPDCLSANFRIVELISQQDYETARRHIHAKSAEIDAMIRALPKLPKAIEKIVVKKRA